MGGRKSVTPDARLTSPPTPLNERVFPGAADHVGDSLKEQADKRLTACQQEQRILQAKIEDVARHPKVEETLEENTDAKNTARLKEIREDLLLSAIGKCDTGRLRALLKGGSVNGKNAMHFAAEAGCGEAMRLLKKAGLCVNEWIREDSGITPLHTAAAAGRLEAVKVALDLGAWVDAETQDGETALHKAVSNGHSKVVSELIARGIYGNVPSKDGETALHKAASNGHSKVVSELITRDTYVHVPSKDGETALHKAASNGHSKVVSELIACGIYVNMPSKDGETALHKAASNGHSKVVSELIARGIYVHVPSKDGETALHKAASNGHSKVVSELIACGIYVNVPLKDGETALHKATSNGHSKVVSELIARGIYVNVPSKENDTALHAAARTGDETLISLLIDAGADLLAVNQGTLADYWGGSVLHKIVNDFNDCPKVAENIRVLGKAAGWTFVNHGDKEEHTVLSRAVLGSKEAFTAALLDSRAALPCKLL
eukprot:Cvel_24209.t1-p1 / transcript=Cvel_24209.t1 / gene=Cvel_24209 / organism=Chromera_velia_CCMP2878 / gene_product=Serine/threonine-protein phosphatase 6 regulatory, putative / transcript_product=Serine/threonine-protein phosphatase 6 regulatory, putative / location=Cvel_scaffold2587:5403-14940(-) / protein_length=490 / sequence_SO=supercontig / SO=protein_coding / is_pseudo=false